MVILPDSSEVAQEYRLFRNNILTIDLTQSYGCTKNTFPGGHPYHKQDSHRQYNNKQDNLKLDNHKLRLSSYL